MTDGQFVDCKRFELNDVCFAEHIFETKMWTFAHCARCCLTHSYPLFGMAQFFVVLWKLQCLPTEWRQANGLGIPRGSVQSIPGKCREIDFAGDNLKWIDSNCEVQCARLFIAVLPYSNLTNAEAYPNEKQQS